MDFSLLSFTLPFGTFCSGVHIFLFTIFNFSIWRLFLVLPWLRGERYALTSNPDLTATNSNISQATPAILTFCGGVYIHRFRQAHVAITQFFRYICTRAIFCCQTPYNQTFCGGVTCQIILWTLCCWAFCSGATHEVRQYCCCITSSLIAHWTLSHKIYSNAVVAAPITPNNKTFCGGVICQLLIFTLCNWAFCSGAKYRYHYRCCRTVVIFTLCALTFCSGVFDNKEQSIRIFCGGIISKFFHFTLSNWAFCSGATFEYSGDSLLDQQTTPYQISEGGIPASLGIVHLLLQHPWDSCSGAFTARCKWFCNTLCRWVLLTVPLPDLFFGGGAAGPSTKRFYRYFCFADFWQRSWRGLAQAITLSNWTFCSGVIFLVSTPYNWTFCGGVISILTLYNWAFCSGVNFSISIQHNYSFCSGVLTILTLCNWIFCSKVQAIRFLELRWAIYLNLALTGCRIHRLTGIRRIVEYCLRCEHRANLSLIFPVLHFDLTSIAITTYCWQIHICNSILVWRFQQLGLYTLWFLLQLLWTQKTAARFLNLIFTVICLCVPPCITWLLHPWRLSAILFHTCWCRSGPKSRRPFGKIFLGLCCLCLIMFSGHLDRGEGCDPVMRVTETSADSDWMTHLPNIADVKQHDLRPPVSSALQSRSPTQVTKRSLKRAQKRAYQNGVAWYKGRLYQPEDFHFMPPLDPALVPPAEPTNAATAQLASCNRKHGSRRRITCMQWNVGGLSRHRLDEVKSWLSTQHVQVITLIETRWSYTGEWLDPDWIHIHSGLPGSKGTGILTLISRKLCSDRELRWQEVDVGRLVHVRIPTPGRPLDLICGYQHVDTRSASCLQKRDTWWNKLDQVLQCIPQRNLLLVMADFNCNVPECTSYSGSEWYRWGKTLTKGLSIQTQDACYPCSATMD